MSVRCLHWWSGIDLSATALCQCPTGAEICDFYPAWAPS